MLNKISKICLLSLIFIGSINSFAQDNSNRKYSKNDFYFNPAITLEYNIPIVSGAGDNKKFNNKEHIIKQLYNIENIAVGAHIRFHDGFGINANWVQTTMDSASLQHRETLSKEAIYKVDQYNFSALTYIPLIKKFFELYGETGVAHLRDELSYQTISGQFVMKNSRQSRFFYGLGAQLSLNDITTIRVSAQRYVGNFGLLGSNYTTIRLGVMRFF